MGSPRRVKILSAAEMALLPTPRLLAYRRKMLALEASVASDREPHDSENPEPGYVYFKASPDAIETAATAKAILDTRPNVD